MPNNPSALPYATEVAAELGPSGPRTRPSAPAGSPFATPFVSASHDAIMRFDSLGMSPRNVSGGSQ